MDVFISTLSDSISNAITVQVMKELRQKLVAFASAVSDATDGKVSTDDVMEMWAKIDPDFKVKGKSKTRTVQSSESSSEPSTGCVAICVSGMKKGEACGKICKDGNDKCGIHLKASHEVKVSSAETNEKPEKSEKIKKPTVKELKELADAKGLTYPSKITHAELVALLKTGSEDSDGEEKVDVAEHGEDAESVESLNKKFEKSKIPEMKAMLESHGITVSKARPSRAELLELWHTRVHTESKVSEPKVSESKVSESKKTESKKVSSKVEQTVPIDPKITIAELKEMFVAEGVPYPKGNKANAIQALEEHLLAKRAQDKENEDEENEDDDETDVEQSDEEEIEEVHEEEVDELDEEELEL